MNDNPAARLADRPSALPPQGWINLFRHFWRLAGGFWREATWLARGLTAALVALTAGQVMVQVALNLWTERLFDAFGTKSMSGFLLLAGAFAGILLANLAVTTSHLRVRRKLQVSWRQWLTRRISGAWMSSGHHYRMAYMPGDHDNPDGRISEDIRIATEAAVDLAHSLLYSLILVTSFIHILWTLSGRITFSVADVDVSISGHLVWVALAYATVGVSVALLLGPRLVATAEARQTYEANFRFGLVHARENSSTIALVHGENAERRRFGGLLQDAVDAWARQTGALFRFFIFSSSWTVLSPVFPVLIAAPRYIAGTITLGVLMQIAQAFQQTIAGLTWPIDNLSHAADWRASVERILGLQDGIERANQVDWCPDCTRIGVFGARAPLLAFHEVTIVNPAGETTVNGLTMKILPGERIWLCGEPPMTNAIIKTLAGLWTSGRGWIELPNTGPLYFMPQRPYLPLAPIRDLVIYPTDCGEEHDERIAACLRRVGLDDLAERLYETQAWGTMLSLGDQQRIGFARLLFHHPLWIILEEPVDALSAAGEREMMQLLTAEFAESTLIIVGDSAPSGIEWKKMALPAMSGASSVARSAAAGDHIAVG